MAEKTILLVDDSLIVHRVLGAAMEGSGYEFAGHAYDGDQAVKLFTELRPTVVLLDIIMPKKGGLEVLRESLALDPSAVVIMASSYGTESAVDEALEAGAKGFIQKPYSPDRLIQLLDRNTA